MSGKGKSNSGVGMGSTDNSTGVNSKAMLVVLALSAWSARKYDRQVSEDVARRNRTTIESGRYNKQLIGKDSLAEISKIDNAIRTYHYQQTLPWSNEGARIIPLAMYFDYVAKMNEFKRDRADAVRELVRSYPQLRANAATRLGGLFKQEDYPEVSEIDHKFAFSVDFLPLPDAGDFRLDMNKRDLERLRKETDERINEAVGSAMQDVWKRVYGVVSKMADRLKQYSPDDGNGKVKNPFRDSTIDNVRELVEILPKLNFTGDADLDRMSRRLMKELCKHPADLLRTDERVRRDTAKQADKILRDMVGYCGEIA